LKSGSGGREEGKEGSDTRGDGTSKTKEGTHDFFLFGSESSSADSGRHQQQKLLIPGREKKTSRETKC